MLWDLRDIKTKTEEFKEDLTSDLHHKIREKQPKAFFNQPLFIQSPNMTKCQMTDISMAV